LTTDRACATVGGYIAGNLGYQYIFWITLALTAFTFLCQLFLVPETIFDRAAHLRQEEDAASYSNEKGGVQHNESAVGTQYQGSFSFAQSLKFGLYRGHVLRHFIAPWKTLVFPGTWVVMMHYGGLLGGQSLNDTRCVL
jgi:MFS family permease